METKNISTVFYNITSTYEIAISTNREALLTIVSNIIDRVISTQRKLQEQRVTRIQLFSTIGIVLTFLKQWDAALVILNITTFTALSDKFYPKEP